MNVRLPAAERRAQLLDHALVVFATDGYHEATMDRVAAAAGVTKPVLYQHFPSKRELYLELLRRVGDALAEAVSEGAAAGTTGRDQVRRGLRAYFRFVAEHPREFRLLFGEGVRVDAEFAAEVAAVEARLARFTASLIAIDDLSDADRLVLAHGIVGLAEATGRHWTAVGRPGSPDAMAERVAELAWFGLRGHP